MQQGCHVMRYFFIFQTLRGFHNGRKSSNRNYKITKWSTIMLMTLISRTRFYNSQRRRKRTPSDENTSLCGFWGTSLSATDKTNINWIYMYIYNICQSSEIFCIWIHNLLWKSFQKRIEIYIKLFLGFFFIHYAICYESVISMLSLVNDSK